MGNKTGFRGRERDSTERVKRGGKRGEEKDPTRIRTSALVPVPQYEAPRPRLVCAVFCFVSVSNVTGQLACGGLLQTKRNVNHGKSADVLNYACVLY